MTHCKYIYIYKDKLHTLNCDKKKGAKHCGAKQSGCIGTMVQSIVCMSTYTCKQCDVDEGKSELLAAEKEELIVNVYCITMRIIAVLNNYDVINEIGRLINM